MVSDGEGRAARDAGPGGWTDWARQMESVPWAGSQEQRRTCSFSGCFRTPSRVPGALRCVPRGVAAGSGPGPRGGHSLVGGAGNRQVDGIDLEGELAPRKRPPVGGWRGTAAAWGPTRGPAALPCAAGPRSHTGRGRSRLLRGVHARCAGAGGGAGPSPRSGAACPGSRAGPAGGQRAERPKASYSHLQTWEYPVSSDPKR